MRDDFESDEDEDGDLAGPPPPAVVERAPDDPADIGFPPTLPLEVAMRSTSPQKLRQAYGIPQEEWDRLKTDPVFAQAVAESVEMLKQPDAMFRTKLKAQAEGLLPRLWDLAHGDPEIVPPNVSADLIKFAIKAAGLDASIEQKASATAKQASVQVPLQINLVLG